MLSFAHRIIVGGVFCRRSVWKHPQDTYKSRPGTQEKSLGVDTDSGGRKGTVDA